MDALAPRRFGPLGPWHAARTTPARAGVYLRAGAAGPYACWDGRMWRAGAASPAAAASVGVAASYAAAWRGLTVPAELPCATCRGHTLLDRGVDEESGADLISECPDC